MSQDFEDQLRAALRHVDPAPDFAERVLEKIERRPPRSLFVRLRWPVAAMAASIMFGIVVVHERQVRHEREGLEARRQLIEALRVTGEKLDLAYRVVNSESHPPSSDDAGA